ncbi:unnamed protein product [Lactuca saligna]|uniref:RING-type E3 ubiquitin transferase n=1 Tax=Lactuca saligna TaxID=75948 RepID=A0AA35VPF8_LACSI|nr:unnamed protein product [Lactuca saligna]
MAEVSYLHLHENDDEDGEYNDRDEVVVSFSSHNNWSHGVDAFDVYPSDLDCPSFDDFFCHTDRNNDSVLFDREYQVNFVIDMFHQRVEQSQSQSHLAIGNGFCNPDRSTRQGNEEMDANDLELEFGLGLDFPVEVNDNRNDGDDNLGFMLGDCGDDFIVPRRTTGDPSSRSGGPEHLMVPDLGSDSYVDGGNALDFGINESNLRLEDFQLEDDNERGETNPNEDFEWEEVDGRIDDREVLNMMFESEPDDDTSDLPRTHPDSHEYEEEQPHQWEVLLNVHNPDLEPGTYDDESNYTEYEMFIDPSSFGRPPASMTVVKNLLSVVITDQDFEKNNIRCAVCKDEIGVGVMAKQLPCGHRYHGDCILPWLCIRNTCPVCRHELPTDDPEYERRKAERGVSDQ